MTNVSSLRAPDDLAEQRAALATVLVLMTAELPDHRLDSLIVTLDELRARSELAYQQLRSNVLLGKIIETAEAEYDMRDGEPAEATVERA